MTLETEIGGAEARTGYRTARVKIRRRTGCGPIDLKKSDKQQRAVRLAAVSRLVAYNCDDFKKNPRARYQVHLDTGNDGPFRGAGKVRARSPGNKEVDKIRCR